MEGPWQECAESRPSVGAGEAPLDLEAQRENWGDPTPSFHPLISCQCPLPPDPVKPGGRGPGEADHGGQPPGAWTGVVLL